MTGGKYAKENLSEEQAQYYRDYQHGPRGRWVRRQFQLNQSQKRHVARIARIHDQLLACDPSRERVLRRQLLNAEIRLKRVVDELEELRSHDKSEFPIRTFRY